MNRFLIGACAFGLLWTVAAAEEAPTTTRNGWTLKEGVHRAERIQYVPSGKLRNVGFLMGAYPDCTPWNAAETEVRMLKEPEHGTVEIVAGENYGSFTDEPRTKCNGKKIPGMWVKYKSVKGYTGLDEFDLLAMYETGVRARCATRSMCVERANHVGGTTIISTRPSPGCLPRRAYQASCHIPGCS